MIVFAAVLAVVAWMCLHAFFRKWDLMTEPCDLPATEARRLIGRRALSPVELLESCIARIQAVEPAVNAMPALDLPGARAAAAKAEQAVMSGEDLPPLHGLPLGVKDLTAAANLPFTRGSPIFP